MGEITCRHTHARLVGLPLRQQQLVVGSEGSVAETCIMTAFPELPIRNFITVTGRLAYQSAAYFGYLILTSAGTASGPEAENSGGRGCRTPLCCWKGPWCRVVFRFLAGLAYTCLFASSVTVEASWWWGHTSREFLKDFDNKYPQTYQKSHTVPPDPSAS